MEQAVMEQAVVDQAAGLQRAGIIGQWLRGESRCGLWRRSGVVIITAREGESAAYHIGATLISIVTWSDSQGLVGFGQ